MKRNQNLAALKTNYLFPEIQARKCKFLQQYPHASLISLGIGDTTEPIPRSIAGSLCKASEKLGSRQGYSGYGPEQGNKELREKISSKMYNHLISSEEIFISDGAKCDLGRLQALFGGDISIAVQDPAYPVYIEGSLIQGVRKVVLLPCIPENSFFPDLESASRTDLIYFCSPNNPTGSVAAQHQLEKLVQFAKRNGSVIIFDAAYASYIQDPSLPKSIYEIEGAKEVAIEVHSFSKLAGFTGIRLGWTVVPTSLKYDDGASIHADWHRLISTIFNGASNIAQAGGLSVLEDGGLRELTAMTSYYLENAKILKQSLLAKNYEVYGGEHAPYLWVRFRGKNSWDTFQHLLEYYHLVTTPGLGFGPSGEECIRLTAFGNRKEILKAAERISQGIYREI